MIKYPLSGWEIHSANARLPNSGSYSVQTVMSAWVTLTGDPAMRSRLLFLNWAAATVALIASAQSTTSPRTTQASAQSTAAIFSPLQNREPVISLDGMWRFHPGDDQQWASPHFDDSAWPLLRSDQSWTAQGYKDQNGSAWYRFRAQAPSGTTPLALLLPAILTDYEVFANGVKIGAFGQMPPHGSLRFNQTLLYPGIRSIGHNELSLQHICYLCGRSGF